jgi:hypothetical protein
LHCSETFKTYPNWIKRGGGKFCSRKCKGLFYNKKVNKSCELCESEFIVKPSTLIHNASRFCSPECGQIASIGRDHSYCTGENHPNWKGGVSFYPYGLNPYPSKFNDNLKESIRKRDNYECRICKLQEEEHLLVWGTNLQIHHIDYKKINCEESNLVSLCNQCHGRTNYNRGYWRQYFATLWVNKFYVN